MLEKETSNLIVTQRPMLFEGDGIVIASEENDSSILLDKKYRKINQWVLQWRDNPPSEWHVLKPEVFISAGGSTLTY